MYLKEWEDALKLCKQAIELIHPVLTSEEPCVAYEAWNNAKKLLERKPVDFDAMKKKIIEYFDAVTNEQLEKDLEKAGYSFYRHMNARIIDSSEPPKPTRKEWILWIQNLPRPKWIDINTELYVWLDEVEIWLLACPGMPKE